MWKQAIALGIALVLGASAFAQPARSAQQGQSIWEARAKFIKKCFRDQTKQSCDAPPQARLPVGA